MSFPRRCAIILSALGSRLFSRQLNTSYRSIFRKLTVLGTEISMAGIPRLRVFSFRFPLFHCAAEIRAEQGSPGRPPLRNTKLTTENRHWEVFREAQSYRAFLVYSSDHRCVGAA